jgi:phenylalanine-4-hydroxylase
LDEFACQMALRRGGLYGLNKAIESENIATCEYSSGLQVTGIFTDVIDISGNPVYLKTTGPTSLNYRYKQLDGHGKNYHAHGFGSPIGKLINTTKPLEFLTESELGELGIKVNAQVFLKFESGIEVKGKVKNIITIHGVNLLISLIDCRVTYNDQVLFEPAWGVFDMAVGEKIYSAFSGAADPDAYAFSFEAPREKTHKIIYSEKEKYLHSLYQKVRDARENASNGNSLRIVFDEVVATYPSEWLLFSELYEIADGDFRLKFESHLNTLRNRSSELKTLIDNAYKVYG